VKRQYRDVNQEIESMINMMISKMPRLAVSVATVFFLALPVSAVVTYNTRALSGEVAPGTSGVYESFGFPVIDDTGRTAFRALLLNGAGGVTSANDRGLWSEGSGSLSLVAREGSVAPGTVGGVYSFLDRININGAGKVAYSSPLLQGTGDTIFGNHVGIWSEGSGSLSLVARGLSSAPDTGDGVFGFISSPLINGTGQIAFSGNLMQGTGGVTGADDLGIWSEGSGSLSLVVREGSAAPGTAGGVVFSDSLGPSLLNDAGQIAFVGGLAGTDVTAANDVGIWSEGSGSLSLIAREGSTAPGTAGGRYSVLVGDLAFNDAGQTAFNGALLVGSGDVTSANDHGIWSEGSGSLSLIARRGSIAPGTSGGVFFGLDTPALNGAGQTTFRGLLLNGTGGVTPENDSGIWFEDSGSVSLIAREGSAAPDTAGVFNKFNGGLIFNDAGQIAFNGILRLEVGVVTLANDRGIWATDPNGVLRLVVREGDLFDVNDDSLIDDIRTIESIEFLIDQTGGQDGRSTAFNDVGQLAFSLNFTDGSEGVFVATIPEPGTMALLLAGSLVLVRRL
jgi:hypothetical protein